MKKFEENLQSAMKKIKPNQLNDIIVACENEEVNHVEVMNNFTSRRSWHKPILALAMAFVLGFGGYSLYTTHLNQIVESQIGLDVNPSLEIQLNRNDKVVGVIAGNKEAEEIIGDMDFRGSDLKVTVNALIGSMLRNGYLSELRNSILVTVENNDPAKAKLLQEELMKEIDEILESDLFKGSVLAQTIKEDRRIKDLSTEYKISVGKAQLIDEIVNENPVYTFADLAKLSINDLNILNAKSNKEKTELLQSGEASKKEYLTEDEAFAAAYKHAGIKESDVVSKTIEIDYDKGVMVYEIEFYTSNGEYDVELNAKTGEILEYQKEVTVVQEKPVEQAAPAATPKPQAAAPATTQQATAAPVATPAPAPAATPTPQAAAPSVIGPGAAQNIALSHAGVSSPSGLYAEYDAEDNDYDVEFYANGYEYDYEIDASTGAIKDFSKEYED